MSETRYGFLQTKLGHGGFPTADSLTYQFCSSVLVLFTSRVWWDMLSATSLSGHTRLESQIEPLDYPKWEILCLITFANPTLPLFSVVLEKRRKDPLRDRNTSEQALWRKLNLRLLFFSHCIFWLLLKNQCLVKCKPLRNKSEISSNLAGIVAQPCTWQYPSSPTKWITLHCIEIG